MKLLTTPLTLLLAVTTRGQARPMNPGGSHPHGIHPSTSSPPAETSRQPGVWYSVDTRPPPKPVHRGHPPTSLAVQPLRGKIPARIGHPDPEPLFIDNVPPPPPSPSLTLPHAMSRNPSPYLAESSHSLGQSRSGSKRVEERQSSTAAQSEPSQDADESHSASASQVAHSSNPGPTSGSERRVPKPSGTNRRHDPMYPPPKSDRHQYELWRRRMRYREERGEKVPLPAKRKWSRRSADASGSAPSRQQQSNTSDGNPVFQHSVESSSNSLLVQKNRRKLKGSENELATRRRQYRDKMDLLWGAEEDKARLRGNLTDEQIESKRASHQAAYERKLEKERERKRQERKLAAAAKLQSQAESHDRSPPSRHSGGPPG